MYHKTSPRPAIIKRSPPSTPPAIAAVGVPDRAGGSVGVAIVEGVGKVVERGGSLDQVRGSLGEGIAVDGIGRVGVAVGRVEVVGACVPLVAVSVSILDDIALSAVCRLQAAGWIDVLWSC